VLVLAVSAVHAPVHAAPLVTLGTPRVIAEAIDIPTSGNLCWGGVAIRIHVERPSYVTVRLNNHPVASSVDDSDTASDGTKRLVGRGPHRIIVDPDTLSSLGYELGVRVPFAVDVRDARDGRLETVAGMVETDLANPPSEILLHRDDAGRLVRVEEKQRGGGRLEIAYTRAGGFDRVSEVRDSLQRMTVHYAYDSFGNLVQVTRRQAGKTDVLGRYTYGVEDGLDPHQIRSADAGGTAMLYAYYGAKESFLGEGSARAGLQSFGRTEYIHDVVTAVGKDLARTRYAYDYSRWRDDVVHSWVAAWDEAKPSEQTVTLYVLDREGRFHGGAGRAGRRAAGPMGGGWSFFWDMSLSAEWRCGCFVVHRAEGDFVFQMTMEGAMHRPWGSRSGLVENPDRTLLLRQRWYPLPVWSLGRPAASMGTAAPAVADRAFGAGDRASSRQRGTAHAHRGETTPRRTAGDRLLSGRRLRPGGSSELPLNTQGERVVMPEGPTRIHP
jgi:YD repeat-containing protein